MLRETLKRHTPSVRFGLLVNEPGPAELSDAVAMLDEVVTIEDLDIREDHR